MGALEKPAKGSTTRARRATARRRSGDVLAQMQAVRDRDRFCRFPLCGCRKPGTYSDPEVSHDRHRGAGGNPSGDRSRPDAMILLCHHRHQDGKIARDKRTLRITPLTDAGNRGPVAFSVLRAALMARPLTAAGLWAVMADPDTPTSTWVEVARERAPHELERLLPWQLAVLTILGDMRL